MTVQNRTPIRTPIDEGKTKIICAIDERPRWAEVVSKDDLTAGNGEKHDVLEGKGQLNNTTAVNIFTLLAHDATTPLAFQSSYSQDSFIAMRCKMLPLEVVARRRAFGSYCKRNPHVPESTVFPRLVLEFFLKTKGKRWGELELPKDDPYMDISPDGMMNLYQPDKPPGTAWCTGEYTLPENVTMKHIQTISRITPHVFRILEQAFRIADGSELIDFKLEFGINANNELCLADVITADEIRLMKNGQHESKEAYRRGGQLDLVKKIYERVADSTSRFVMFPPQQEIILWRGSDKDPVEPFMKALGDIGAIPGLRPCIHVVCSMHKEPIRGAIELALITQENPNAVVVALIGRSNGAGPTLSALTHLNVITVPVGWDKFPEDVWSSLRTPSNVPVTTCLTPENAALHAMQILARSNPFIYARLRAQLEERLKNVIEI
jgi:phosphoribosylaminoimidazole carboxylase/phosphoribosylaminoimidazole-succinocarboxamide synthase